MENQRTIKDHYIYQASAGATLAVGASVTDNINIEADSNFVVVKLAYNASIADATLTESTRVVPLVNIQIVDSGSGRNLQSDPIPIDSMAGRGELPFILPIPRTFKARSNISVTFTNVSAAAIYTNLTLSLIGYKTFYLGS